MNLLVYQEKKGEITTVQLWTVAGLQEVGRRRLTAVIFLDLGRVCFRAERWGEEGGSFLLQPSPALTLVSSFLPHPVRKQLWNVFIKRVRGFWWTWVKQFVILIRAERVQNVSWKP